MREVIDLASSSDSEAPSARLAPSDDPGSPRRATNSRAKHDDDDDGDEGDALDKQARISRTLGEHLTAMLRNAADGFAHLLAPDELAVMRLMLDAPEPSRFLLARLAHRSSLWLQDRALRAMDPERAAAAVLPDALLHCARSEDDWTQVARWSLDVAQLRSVRHLCCTAQGLTRCSLRVTRSWLQ